MEIQEKNWQVYKHTIGGKSYIGITSTGWKKRLYSHIWLANTGSNSEFQVAIRTYGKKNIETEILYETKSHADAIAKETHFIEVYDTYQNGYNMTNGGEGGFAVPREESPNWKGQTKEEILDLACAVIVENEGFWIPSEYAERAESMGYPVNFYGPFGENWREILLSHAQSKGIDIDQIETTFTPEMSKRIGKATKDSKWYSNHITEQTIRIKPGELPPDDNWVIGRFYETPNKDAIVYYHPETREKRFIKPNDEIPDGFIKGTPSEKTSIYGRHAYTHTETGEVKFFSPDDDIPDVYEKGDKTKTGQQDKKAYTNKETGEIKFFADNEKPDKNIWTQKGYKSVIKGKTRYIHRETFKISYFDPEHDEIPDGFQTEEPEGFVSPNSNAGKEAYTNVQTGKCKMFRIEDEIPKGWVKGNSNAPSPRGKVWWSCPVTKKRTLIGKDETPPAGYVKGRGGISPILGRRACWNPQTGKIRYIKKDELIPHGWIEGGKKTTKEGDE